MPILLRYLKYNQKYKSVVHHGKLMYVHVQYQVCNACGFVYVCSLGVYMKYVMHHSCIWVACYMVEVFKEELKEGTSFLP